jgi:hypothetical protein
MFISIGLLSSCTFSANVTQDNIALVEKEEAHQKSEPPSLSTQNPEEYTSSDAFSVLSEYGMTLDYPSDWEISERDFREPVVYEVRIKKTNNDKMYIGIQIANDITYDGIVDAGFEKRKEEADMFYEHAASSSENSPNISFEDVMINNNEFYKITMAYAEDGRQIVLATVKNSLRYDVFINFDPLKKEEQKLTEDIFNSIQITDI